MEKLPIAIGELAAGIKWPPPKPNGTTTIDAQMLRQLQALIASMTNYIETQLSLCKIPADGV